MASFGGSIKLTGADEYKNALKQITQSLRETGSELTAVASRYDKNDSSLSTLKAKTTELNAVLAKQVQAYNNLKGSYDTFSAKVGQQAQAHDKLVQTYEKEKQELENIRKASGESSQAFQDQQAKVNDLASAVAKSSQNMNENQIALSKMKTQLNQAETTVNKTTKEIDELGNETEESGEKAKRGAEGYTVFKGILADLGSKAIQSALNGLKQLGSALINVGKQAVTSYADYEQLVGGVETLFKDSAGIVEDYANQAYKTAGLSANEYMETITSFSASLIQGLGGDTKKASEIGNMAIIDMSDNANKMGTSIEMIQNAYQGFAKDNFTMLDNLKLGYGGTASEMARLINETGVMGESFKATAQNVKDVPFDKMVEAIHQVQEEMGITGTTFKEADGTITGSVNSMKASWQKLLTGIADGNQEIGPLVDDFVDSVATSYENLKPRIQQTVNGIKELIGTIFEKLPEISEDFPELKPLTDALKFIVDNGPLIISTLAGIVAGMTAFKVAGAIKTVITGFQIFFTTIKTGKGIMAGLNAVMSANPIGLIASAVAGLVTAFITLWNTSEGFRNFWIGLWENIKSVFTTVAEAIGTFFTETIPNAFNSFIEKLTSIKDTVVEFFTVTIPNAVSTFVQSVIDFFMQLPEKVSEIIQSVIDFINELPYQLGLMIGQMIGNIINFGTDVAEWVTTTIPAIIESIVTFFSELPDKIWTWLVNAYEKVTTWGSNMKQKAIETGSNFINNVINFIKELPSKIWAFLTDIISKVTTWATNMAQKGKEGAKNTFDNIVNGFKELPSKMLEIGRNVVEGLWNGIKNAGNWIRQKVGEFAQGILDGMKNALGIHSPSTVFRDQVGKNLALGIGEGFSDEMANVTSEMQSSIPTSFDTDLNVGSGSVSGSSNYSSMVDAFKQALSEMKIELDDEVAGRFVETTVANAIYN